MAENGKTRPVVSAERFLEIVDARRSEFPTKEAAAKALGLTINSFNQRMSRERKRNPATFESIPFYRTNSGPKVLTDAEMTALRDKVRASVNSTDSE